MKRTIVLGLIGVCFARAGQAQEAVKKELTDLEYKMNEATVKKDRAFLERAYADDYYCIHSNGVGMNKAKELAETMSASSAWTDFKLDDLAIRLYGDVAILTARLTLKGTAKGFKPGARRFTDIFVRRGGRWQLVGCQSTLVPTQKT